MGIPKIILGLILLLSLSMPLHGAQDKKFELSGKIVQDDGKPFNRVTPIVVIQGAVAPYYKRTLAGRDGSFKFKDLNQGMYTLTVAVPRAGEMLQTVEVSPALADAKGKVIITIHFERNPQASARMSVPASQLSVPASARQEYRDARNRLERRDVDGAIAHLQKAVKIAPQFAAAWNYLGTIAYQNRKYPQAEEYFREALKQNPDSYPPTVNLGAALLAQKKLEESLEYNRMAVEMQPDDALAFSQLGQNYYFLNETDKAESALKKAKILDPAHFSFPQLVLASIYYRRRNFKAVISELEEFLTLHPDAPSAPQVRKMLDKTRASMADDERQQP